MAVLKSPQRIDAIAAHIAQHFQENVMPRGLKALVVTPDREACALYKAGARCLPADRVEHRRLFAESQEGFRPDEGELPGGRRREARAPGLP